MIYTKDHKNPRHVRPVSLSGTKAQRADQGLLGQAFPGGDPLDAPAFPYGAAPQAPKPISETGIPGPS